LNERGHSGDASFAGSIGVERQLMHDTRRTAHIELEHAGNHNDGLGSVSILEKGEPECFGAVDEQATAKVLLVLDNPVAAAVLADKEEGRSRARSRRGRFL
jgi:hypothetical protein